ncbi:hypothetical protein EMIT047CA2_70248 [Pseudomonas soli]
MADAILASETIPLNYKIATGPDGTVATTSIDFICRYLSLVMASLTLRRGTQPTGNR